MVLNNDMVSKGSFFKPSCAHKLQRAVSDYSAGIASIAEGSVERKVFDHVGLGSSSVGDFVEAVSNAVAATVLKQQRNSVVHIRKLITDTTSLISRIPDLEQSGEATYRKQMKSLTGKLADKQELLEEGTSAVVSAFERDADKFQDQAKSLVSQVADVKDTCMFRVCFTFYRSPGFGTDSGAKPFAQFESIMMSLQACTTKATFRSSLLEEMEAQLSKKGSTRASKGDKHNDLNKEEKAEKEKKEEEKEEGKEEEAVGAQEAEGVHGGGKKRKAAPALHRSARRKTV